MKKESLKPLIPLDEFGKLVSKIARVPKDEVGVRDAEPPKKAKATQKKSP